MNRLLSMAFSATLLLTISGCAGHNANPVMAVQYGDEGLSCRGLELSMSEAQSEMQRLVGDTDKTGQNAALGVAGVFLIVPWFFMDFKDGEKVEYDAWRQRYNQLAIRASEKHCGLKIAKIPSASELEKDAAAARQKQKTTND